MTRKQLKTIISEWNPQRVLYIRYESNHSCGKITCSFAFFLEMYNKLYRLLKRCKIREIYLKNEDTGIVLMYYDSLYDAWMYGIGEKYR